jgi:hypothetical protein
MQKSLGPDRKNAQSDKHLDFPSGLPLQEFPESPRSPTATTKQTFVSTLWRARHDEGVCLLWVHAEFFNSTPDGFLGDLAFFRQGVEGGHDR